MSWILAGLTTLYAAGLPMGSAPDPASYPHFPTRTHAYVWFNWPLVPVERLASVVKTSEEEIVSMGRRMGLPEPPAIPDEQWRRSYITIIRRNWHLLPYEQLLALLDWTPEQLAYTLREDDFLFIKLGRLKPKCAPLRYEAPTEAVQRREAEIALAVEHHFPQGIKQSEEPLFGFVEALSSTPLQDALPVESRFSPRFCSSYFALYGDPFLNPEIDGYPEGYLARLAQSGVNGVWLQAVLHKLTPFPWDPKLSEHHAKRLANLEALVARAKKHGIGVYLYLNEPRAMPLPFFEGRTGLHGVTEGDYAVLCTSVPAVQDYLRGSVAAICKAVPDLAGFFTITASENLTNCWSHHNGAACSRCRKAGPEAVIAGVNRLVWDGIRQADSEAKLIAWDWGWKDEWAPGIIERLPVDVSLMSVSEWSIPVQRGGVDTVVGEYSLSVVGPGPRATRHWELARERGMKTIAKVQAGNTWELSSVPYIPAVENAARHAAAIRAVSVDGIMLGWTLGGHPSPNLAVYAEMGRPDAGTVEDVLSEVAKRRYGERAAPAVVDAWRAFSAAFQKFPYHGAVLYNAPMQMGPANPLWETPTGYRATMVGLPYDALDSWRGPFPPEVFRSQFEKMADGFDTALVALRQATSTVQAEPEQARNIAREKDVAEVCTIHFQSVANQAGFVMAREALARTDDREEAARHVADLEDILLSEIDLATRLHAIQQRDSRIGFEATNHYFYVPLDLVAKVVNCEHLLQSWLPEVRRAHGLKERNGP